MNVLMAGSTGMIGKLVLWHCLNSNKITEVRSLVRKPSGLRHPKLKELVVADFEDYASHQAAFKEIAVAFFCIGVYTGQVAADEFKRITVNYPLAFAQTLAAHSPQASICLLSGAGADRTEKSKTAFARYKGMAENGIAALPLQFYSFRPAYIYPSEPRKEPNFAYKLMKMCYPLIKTLGPKYSITSVALAAAIFKVGLSGADKQILENQDILKYSI